MKLEEVARLPGRGCVFIASPVDRDSIDHRQLNDWAGSPIAVRQANGTEREWEATGVSLSFSIAGSPLVGLSVRGEASAELIRKGSIITKKELSSLVRQMGGRRCRKARPSCCSALFPKEFEPEYTNAA